MRHEVVYTEGAIRDLEELFDYLGHYAAPGRALKVLELLESKVQSLRESPERGSFPPELLALGSRDFREIVQETYRIIYYVASDKVNIVLVADGRRDFQRLLQRRLLVDY